MRRRIGPLVSTLAAVPLLFLGWHGAENLFWGFQTGFVGSVMFGVWALFFIERSTRRSAVIASLLLVGSLASSGMGLFFLVVAAGRTILDPSLRPRALAVVPPLGVYVLLVHGLVGRDPLGDGRVFVEPSIARFAVRGIVYSTERISGLDHLPERPAVGVGPVPRADSAHGPQDRSRTSTRAGGRVSARRRHDVHGHRLRSRSG